jgi:hypothetical protein
MKQEHPDWGKKRIADEMAKKNSWVPVVSPNTVKRILQEAGMWTRVEEEVKKKQNRQPVEQPRSQNKQSM